MTKALAFPYRDVLYENRDARSILTDLAHANGWMLDVDGCLVKTSKAGGAGGKAIEGAARLLDWLRRNERKFVVCTNASQRTVATYAAHLRDIGLDIADHEMMTAATAAGDTIARAHPGARVLVVGDEGMAEAVRGSGLDVVAPDTSDADAVVVGAADNYASANLNAACISIADHGAALYTSVSSPWFHGGVNRSIAVSSAIAHAIASVTGVQPIVCGKPSKELGQSLRRRLGGGNGQIVIVGDAAQAEMALARDMDAMGVLVLSGATQAKDLPDLPSGQQPHWIAHDVGELVNQLQSIVP
ncbi:MAG TPA: HAD hydrolase-like protein [Eoetvoesiella sp.]|jgi:HAD superfamily hydrolase (TIGR01450 family)|uniref:HAD-IIA family hydrolase n=1 Tax=Eoetvoesiella sp. TaxID=1966355 RepID=UPI002BB0E732|nr:HAD hydrolase-like protein [Eoetvoesiella sp.]HWK61562.1 HAD hydrolase-like protein [Eoetvoesiella sp.]